MKRPKRTSRSPEQAAPEDWMAVLNACDLDEAFESLDGYNHFHSDTLRGRTRSLQLRSTEAWKYFREAESRIRQFKSTDQNRLRHFFLKVYSFENSMTDESLPDGGNPARTAKYYREVTSFPLEGIWLVDHYKLINRGFYQLHKKNFPVARKALAEAIELTRDALRDDLAALYLTHAVACRGLGDEAASDRSLENAFLAIPALQSTYNMGLFASICTAVLRLWDREADAREWDEFLIKLKVPQKTIAIFHERSQRIIARSAKLQQVFLF
jgi:tetratricopeptide (TPR) repeat protein